MLIVYINPRFGALFVKSVVNLARGICVHPLTRDHRVRAFLRVARWQLQSRLQNEIIIPWVAGQKLALSRGMTGATGNFYLGLHEFTDMLFVLHFLRPGDLFLDIGANVGSYTVLASGGCGAHTVAFEPDEAALVALRRNIGLNGISSLVEVHGIALGAHDGTVPFSMGLGTRNRVSTSAKHRREVRQMTLDANIGNCSPIFCKLDVEGYEKQVLTGAKETLRKDSLKIVAIEWPTQDIVSLLKSYDFQVAFYDPFHRTLTTELNGFPPSNTLFIRDADLLQTRVEAAKAITIFNRQI